MVAAGKDANGGLVGDRVGGVVVGPLGGNVFRRHLARRIAGDEAGEVVVSAVAKRAGAAGDLMVAVAVGGVEGMVGGDGLGGRDGGAFWTASEGRGWHATLLTFTNAAHAAAATAIATILRISPNRLLSDDHTLTAFQLRLPTTTGGISLPDPTTLRSNSDRVPAMRGSKRKKRKGRFGVGAGLRGQVLDRPLILRGSVGPS